MQSFFRLLFTGAVFLFPLVASAQTAEYYETRISQLEDQIRALTNENEKLSFAQAQLSERLERLSKDINLRLQDLEQGRGKAGAAAVTPATPGTASKAPVETTTSPATQAKEVPVLKGTPQEQYQQAFSLVTQGDYIGAEGALKAFIQKNPKDVLAGNAQYWLAETYYARGEYEQASKAFLTGYQNYPQNAKAPDSLLKLGLSLGQLGKSKEACTAYGQLNAKYPNMSSEIRRRVTTERQRLGCS